MINSNNNYEIVLCMIHMAIIAPTIVMALFVLTRIDKTPNIEVYCDGTEHGNKHKFDSWSINKAVTNDNKTTYVTQARKCRRCGFTQFKKSKV